MSVYSTAKLKVIVKVKSQEIIKRLVEEVGVYYDESCHSIWVF